MKQTFRAWTKFCARFYRGAFLAGFTRHLPLMLILAFLGGVLFEGLGCAFGLPLLFWHEHRWPQFIAGVSVAFLVSKMLFIGYLLDTRRPMAARSWRLAIPEDHLDFSRSDAVEGEKFPLAEVNSFMIGGIVSIIVTGIVAGALLWVLSPLSSSPCDSHPDCRYYIFSARSIFANVFLPAGLICGFAFVFLFLRMVFAVIDKTPAFFLRLIRHVDNADEKRLHILSGGMTFLLLFTYFATPLLNWYLYRNEGPRILQFATPALGLCVLFGLISAAYGFISFHVPTDRTVTSGLFVSNGSLLLIVLLILMCGGGLPQYKMRFDNMADYYKNPQPIADYCKIKVAAPLIPSETVHFSTPGKKKKLVIVCVTGGGIRAAVWTASVMRQLERDFGPDFPYHVRLMTGASGGMVGSAYYVSTLRNPQDAARDGRLHDIPEPAEPSWHGEGDDVLVHNLAQDTLSEVVKRMIYEDLPAMVYYPDHIDRGRAMEQQWGLHLGGLDQQPFYSPAARQAEQDGWRPSLIFSPMMVEDGRRLLISNLDLDFMTTSVGPSLDAEPSSSAVYSRSAYEFARLFPRALDHFSMATAARMSASYPYITPAAELPTEPRRRIVDAGYYDTYGVNVAAAWLHHMATVHADWLTENASGVVIIQIRDGVDDLDGDGCNQCLPPSSLFSRGFEWLTSPLEGFWRARQSVSLFRNDANLERLGLTFAQLGPKFPPGYFTTVRFEYSGEAALTWYMSDPETRDIMKHARYFASQKAADKLSQSEPEKFGKADKRNRVQMDHLKRWWGE